MKTIAFISFLTSFLLCSCGMRTADVPLGPSSDVHTVYASLESVPDLRNIIDDATRKTSWLAGDAINVFFGASESNRFVTSESGEVAQFKGSIDVVTGGGEGLTDQTSLWGIYPYDAGNVCDGTHVTLSLPADQPAAENTFANGLFPQIARSWNFYMTFYNLCACVRFTVSSPDIRRVALSGNLDESLAGKVKVSMEGVPAVSEVLSPESEITMSAPDGGCFKPGVSYYLVLFPTTFSEGLTVTYYKETSRASHVLSRSVTLGRNKVSTLSDRDSGLTFENIPLHDWEDGGHVGGEI